MNKTEVLKQLKAMGTAQNRKVYARHGVRGPSFGVSYANLGQLKKKLGRDQRLAEALWASGNHDARVLATMVADPAAFSGRAVDQWARDLDNYVLTDAFSMVVGQSAHAKTRAIKWTKSKSEWLSSAGWNLVSACARDAALSDAYFEKHLQTIERDIHKSPNRTRYAMNLALISIGIRNPALEKKAIAAARRIGKVEVDHGQTSCKTPDAVTYIPKAAAHARRKQKKAATKKKTRKTAAKTSVAKKKAKRTASRKA